MSDERNTPLDRTVDSPRVAESQRDSIALEILTEVRKTNLELLSRIARLRVENARLRAELAILLQQNRAPVAQLTSPPCPTTTTVATTTKKKKRKKAGVDNGTGVFPRDTVVSQSYDDKENVPPNRRSTAYNFEALVPGTTPLKSPAAFSVYDSAPGALFPNLGKFDGFALLKLWDGNSSYKTHARNLLKALEYHFGTASWPHGFDSLFHFCDALHKYYVNMGTYVTAKGERVAYKNKYLQSSVAVRHYAKFLQKRNQPVNGNKRKHTETYHRVFYTAVKGLNRQQKSDAESDLSDCDDIEMNQLGLDSTTSAAVSQDPVFEEASLNGGGASEADSGSDADPGSGSDSDSISLNESLKDLMSSSCNLHGRQTITSVI